MSENYFDWARHFWKSTLDEDLIAEYHAADIDGPPVLKRDQMNAPSDVGHLTVTVQHPALFGKEKEYGDGVGLFCGIGIHLKDRSDGGYADVLPFEISPDDSRKSLLKRLGKPDEEDEEDFWDQWNIDGLIVTALWTEDLKELECVTVYLPQVG